MRKTLTEQNLFERSASRTLLALSLAASLAAFGCTTNRTPGNGEPIRSGPGVGPTAPTSGVTSGSSSGGNTTGYQPMMSSSTHIEPLPTVTTRSKRLPLSPDEAAAVMADNLLGRGVRVLGPANPGSAGRPYASDAVAMQPQSQSGYPIITVNSSINSVAHVPAFIGGAGSGGVAGTTGISGVTAASTIGGTTTTSGTAGATALGTTAANGGVPTGFASSSAATPTAAGVPFTAGSFAAGPGAGTNVVPGTGPAVASSGTLTPTVSSSAVPTPTPASSGALATGIITTPVTATTTTNGTTRGTARVASTNGTARSASVTTNGTTAATGAAASATVANPIRIMQDASGKVIVTNATTSTRTSPNSSKSQQ